MTRRQYDAMVRDIRETLEQRRLSAKIHALAVVYGIPIRVAAPPLTEAEEQWRKDATQRRDFSRFAVGVVEQQVNAIGHGSGPPHPQNPTGTPRADDERLSALRQAFQDAASRLATRRPQADTAQSDFVKLVRQAGGEALVLAMVRAEQLSPSDRQRLHGVRQQIGALKPWLTTLLHRSNGDRRSKVYRVTEHLFGATGVLELAGRELDLLDRQVSDASVDSELTLLWWDAPRPIASRTPNPVYASKDSRSTDLGTASLFPIMMVSRLDAPTPEGARKLVDQALTAEAHGPDGTVYLDARGVQLSAPGYGRYDESLRQLGAMMKEQTDYKVVLENTERRFSEPGEAPDVALYIGWYRLRRYEDAFTFRPGAIGFHIASGEAVSLHDPGEQGWCKNALDRGITATLGSIGEPYLDSFPLPLDFVALLLSGRYSLAEVFALTSRYTSWRMVLVGDPLYTPWRSVSRTPEWTASVLERTGYNHWPSSPTERPLADPSRATRDFESGARSAAQLIDSAYLGITQQKRP